MPCNKGHSNWIIADAGHVCNGHIYEYLYFIAKIARAPKELGYALFVASKMLTKRHVAFEHFGRHVLHCFFALPSIKAASMRWLAPLNSTSLPWWTILSIMADASLSSPRTVPHFENSMFVVNIMLRLS